MRFYDVTSWSYVNLDDPGPKKGASDKNSHPGGG